MVHSYVNHTPNTFKMDSLNYEQNKDLILPEFSTFFIDQKVVLTNGFIKKTNKTPIAEKLLAQKYKDDYERRYGNEQL